MRPPGFMVRGWMIRVKVFMNTDVLLVQQKQHLANLLEAIQRCVYF